MNRDMIEERGKPFHKKKLLMLLFMLFVIVIGIGAYFIDNDQKGNDIGVGKWVYNITYELDGGILPENAPKTYDNRKETALVNPTKEGYTFKGWRMSIKPESWEDGFISLETGEDGLGSTGAGCPNAKRTGFIKLNKGVTYKGHAKGFGGEIARVRLYDENKQYIESYDLSEDKKFTITPKTDMYARLLVLDSTAVNISDVYLKVENYVTSIPKGTAGDINLTAEYRPNTFIIKYDVNGGQGTAMADTSMTFGVQKNLNKNTFTKIGNEFNGWYARRTTASGNTAYLYRNESLDQNKWFIEGQETSGYTKLLYKDQAVVERTSGIDKDIVYMEAQWKNIPAPIMMSGPNFNKLFNFDFKQKTKEIQFVKGIPDLSSYTDKVNKWDVSEAQDSSIMAWFDEAKSILFIGTNSGNGTIQANKNCNSMFKNFETFSSNLSHVINFNDLFNTEYTTDMSEMFYSAGGKNEAGSSTIKGLDNWDVSNVTNMNSMFWDYGSLAKDWSIGDLSNWNVSNVTDMGAMFESSGAYATTWSVGDIKNWDVSNVTDMSWMFSTIGTITENFHLDLTDWDTSNVIGINHMFYRTGCMAKNVKLEGLNTWNTSNVQYMYAMFNSFAGESTGDFYLDLTGWDTSKIEVMDDMFSHAGYMAATFTIKGLDNWDTSNVTDMSGMFAGAGSSATNWSIGDLSNWDTSNVTGMYSMFSHIKNLNGSIIIKNPNVEYTRMFESSGTGTNARFLVYHNGLDSDATFDAAENVVATKPSDGKVYHVRNINYHLNGGTMPNNDYVKEYVGNAKLTLPIPIKEGYEFVGWHLTEDINNSSALLALPKGLNGRINIYAEYVKATTGISTMMSGPNFQNKIGDIKSTITEIKFVKGIPDLSGYTENSTKWDVSEAQDNSIYAWLDGTKLFIGTNTNNNIVIANRDCTDMFKDFVLTSTINFNNLFDTSRTIDMSSMFDHVGSEMFKTDTLDFNIVGLENFNTSKVSNMSNMFDSVGYCEGTWSISDISKWNVSNVIDMSYMFNNIDTLSGNAINVGNLKDWDTSNVVNMNCMFSGTYYLDGSITIKNPDVSYNKIFEDCGIWRDENQKHKFYVYHNGTEDDPTFDVVENMIETKGFENSRVWHPREIHYNLNDGTDLSLPKFYTGEKEVLLAADAVEKEGYRFMTYKINGKKDTTTTDGGDVYITSCKSGKINVEVLWHGANLADGKTFNENVGNPLNLDFYNSFNQPFEDTTYNLQAKIEPRYFTTWRDVSLSRDNSIIAAMIQSKVPISVFYEQSGFPDFKVSASNDQDIEKSLEKETGIAKISDSNNTSGNSWDDTTTNWTTRSNIGITAGHNMFDSSLFETMYMHPDSSYMFAGKVNLKTLDFRDAVSTYLVKNMSYMFYNTGINDTTISGSSWAYMNTPDRFHIYGLENFDTRNLENTSHMFDKAGYLDTDWFISDISGWNTSKLKDATAMFKEAGKSAAETPIGDLSNWDTSNLEHADSMFEGIPNLKGAIRIKNPNMTYENMFKDSGTGENAYFLVYDNGDQATYDLAEKIVATAPVGAKIYHVKTINYNLNGGKLPDSYEKYYVGNAEVTLPVPTKDGIGFIGWHLKEDLSDAAIMKLPKNLTGKINIYAEYESPYNINYNLDGGTLPSDAPKTYYSSKGLDTLPVPIKDGYKYKGWNMSFEGLANSIELLNRNNGNTSLDFYLSEDAMLNCDGYFGSPRDNASIINNDTSEIFLIQDGGNQSFTLKKGNYTIIAANRGSIYINIFSSVNNITSIPKGTTGDIALTAEWEEMKRMISGTQFNEKLKNEINNITEIEFVPQIDSAAKENARGRASRDITVYDLSLNQDKSVLGWIKANETKLYISGDGSILANEDCSSMFEYCYNVQSFKFNNLLDVSQTKNMSSMFAEVRATSLTGNENWNTLNVVDMSYMFYNVYYLNGSINVMNPNTNLYGFVSSSFNSSSEGFYVHYTKDTKNIVETELGKSYTNAQLGKEL